jgi:hypothetical protein
MDSVMGGVMQLVSQRLAAAVLILVSVAPAASAQTAEEVVEKYLTAVGGRPALSKLTSRTMVGTISLTTPAGEVSGPIEIENQAPSKSRMLIKLDLSAFGAGQVVVDQRFDGTSGYVIDTFQGNHDLTGAQLEIMKYGAFPSPFLTYREMGATLELGGKEKIGGRDAYLLVLKTKSGVPMRQYLDAESYLPIRTSVKLNIPQFGDLEQVTEFSDYRPVDGVKVPFHITSSSAVQSSTVVITKVEHNAALDQAIFSKPPAGK